MKFTVSNKIYNIDFETTKLTNQKRKKHSEIRRMSQDNATKTKKLSFAQLKPRKSTVNEQFLNVFSSFHRVRLRCIYEYVILFI